MANPTSNFGWQMPTPTDLVTDLPADFEVFGQAVDTSMADLKGGTSGQILAKNSNTDMDFVWVTNDVGDITAVSAGTGLTGGGTSGAVSLAIDTAVTADLTTTQSLSNKTLTSPKISTLTTNGDLLYGTGSSVITRLGIGSTGQVLTVSGGVPSWAAAPSAGANWSIVNTGGTALTGAQTITISGISAKDKILVVVENASSASASSFIGVRFNTDTAANYYTYGLGVSGPASYASSMVSAYSSAGGSNYALLAGMSTQATSNVQGYLMLSGGNAAGVKAIHAAGSASFATGNSQAGYSTGGYYNSSSTISSVSLFSSTGNFDNGTIYVYASA